MEYLTAQNNYPLREWHMEHMQKTIIKYVTGISENTSTNFQKRLQKRYNGNLTYVSKNIAFDIKHGVTNVKNFKYSRNISGMIQKPISPKKLAKIVAGTKVIGV
jgi:hypothetical protein